MLKANFQEGGVFVKALVIEMKGKYAIVVTKKCNFMKIKNDGLMKPGCEVEIPERADFNKKYFIKVASIAAAMVLVMGISFGAYAYNTPYSYISVDINPSVELTANRFDIIINAKGLNDDGEDILQNQSLKNKKVRDGVNVIVSEAAEKGYLSKDREGAVLLTVSSKNQDKADKMKVDLEEKTKEEAEDIGVTIEVMSQNAALERRDQAFEMGITPGRLNLIEKLIAAGSEKKVSEYEDLTVKEIMKNIKDLKLEDKQEKNQENNQEGTRENNQVRNQEDKQVNNQESKQEGTLGDKQTGNSDNASSKSQKPVSTASPKSSNKPEGNKSDDSTKAQSTGKPSEANNNGNNKNK